VQKKYCNIFFGKILFILLQYFWLTDSTPKAPNKTLRQAAKRYKQWVPKPEESSVCN
jgi:hypothetical protein